MEAGQSFPSFRPEPEPEPDEWVFDYVPLEDSEDEPTDFNDKPTEPKNDFESSDGTSTSSETDSDTNSDFEPASKPSTTTPDAPIPRIISRAELAAAIAAIESPRAAYTIRRFFEGIDADLLDIYRSSSLYSGKDDPGNARIRAVGDIAESDITSSEVKIAMDFIASPEAEAVIRRYYHQMEGVWIRIVEICSEGSGGRRDWIWNDESVHPVLISRAAMLVEQVFEW